jgi:hypothetical protein
MYIKPQPSLILQRLKCKTLHLKTLTAVQRNLMRQFPHGKDCGMKWLSGVTPLGHSTPAFWKKIEETFFKWIQRGTFLQIFSHPHLLR